MTDSLTQFISRLRSTNPAQRLAVEFDLHQLPNDVSHHHVEIAELLLEAPRVHGEFGRFHTLSHKLPDVRFLTAASAWALPSLMLSEWKVVEGGIKIEQPALSTGAKRKHRITSDLELRNDDEGHAWSVLPDGGPSMTLREEDMRELERTFGHYRHSFGGLDIYSSAVTPGGPLKSRFSRCARLRLSDLLHGFCRQSTGACRRVQSLRWLNCSGRNLRWPQALLGLYRPSSPEIEKTIRCGMRLRFRHWRRF